MVYSENCTDCLFSGNEPIIVVSESVCGDSIHCRFYAHVQFHQCNGVCEVQLLAFYMQSGCSCPDSQIIKEIMQKIVTRVPCNGNIVRLIAGGCWRHDYAETIGIFQPGVAPNGTPISGNGRRYYPCDSGSCCRAEYATDSTGNLALINKQTIGNCPVEIRDPNTVYAYSKCEPICDWFPDGPSPSITLKFPNSILTKN